MRGDGKLNRSIRDAQSWENSRFDAALEEDAGSELALSIGLSFSGKERNRLFFNRKAKEFVNLSAVSGLDSASDGRVLCLWDFDRDGWQDMVVANANAPLLNIYRNEIGENNGAANEAGHFIAIRFVGGSRTSQPNKQFGPRDGYGARVRVSAGDFTLIREQRCGEGMAGQNSRTMFIGMGANDKADNIAVRWLSGIEQQVNDVPSGTLLTVYEDPETAPEKLAEVREPYIVPSTVDWQDKDTDDAVAVFKTDAESDSQLKIYTTMATWCAACKSHLPRLKQLRSTLSPEQLAMYGLPTDTNDDAEKLSKYEEQNQPPYELLKELPDEQRKLADELILRSLKLNALPSTIITDNEGNVQLVTPGIPTVSQLRKLLQPSSQTE